MSSTIGSLLVMLSAAMWGLSGVCGQFLFENDRSGADVYLQNHAGNSSYAVAFTEGGKKYWMIHTGYDALPSCISGVNLSVERPVHQCCCGERLAEFNLDEK